MALDIGSVFRIAKWLHRFLEYILLRQSSAVLFVNYGWLIHDSRVTFAIQFQMWLQIMRRSAVRKNKETRWSMGILHALAHITMLGFVLGTSDGVARSGFYSSLISSSWIKECIHLCPAKTAGGVGVGIAGFRIWRRKFQKAQKERKPLGLRI